MVGLEGLDDFMRERGVGEVREEVRHLHDALRLRDAGLRKRQVALLFVYLKVHALDKFPGHSVRHAIWLSVVLGGTGDDERRSGFVY